MSIIVSLSRFRGNEAVAGEWFTALRDRQYDDRSLILVARAAKENTR